MPDSQEISQNSESNSENSPDLKCEFCGAVNGERHPVRGFKVKISTPFGYSEGSALACQVCRVAHRSEKQELKLNKSKSKSEKLVQRHKILMLTAFLIFGSIVLIALAGFLLHLFNAM